MKNKGFEPKIYNSLLDRIVYILVVARTKLVRDATKRVFLSRKHS